MLHFDGAVQRVDDARKIGQQAVARGSDNPPAMRRDQRVEGAAELAERSVRAGLILPIRRLKPTTSACRMAASFRFREAGSPGE
jgi:hypothetical protein